jgi:NADH-quinone oxidoreductase subunit C
MDEALIELGETIAAALPDAVLSTAVAFGELSVQAKPEGIVPVLTFLRDDSTCRFSVLIDVCGVDYPDREPRFDVVYNLLSLTYNQRVRVKMAVAEGVPVPAASSVYSTAGWFEREAWDMYGILFSGHHDLRRILTDYGFEGHPLRKDFPLTGFVELRYDDEQKRVVYEPVSLTQEYRTFDFMSPWEGAKYILPDDAGGDDAEPDGGGGGKS